MENHLGTQLLLEPEIWSKMFNPLTQIHGCWFLGYFEWELFGENFQCPKPTGELRVAYQIYSGYKLPSYSIHIPSQCTEQKQGHAYWSYPQYCIGDSTPPVCSVEGQNRLCVEVGLGPVIMISYVGGMQEDMAIWKKSRFCMYTICVALYAFIMLAIHGLTKNMLLVMEKALWKIFWECFSFWENFHLALLSKLWRFEKLA